MEEKNELKKEISLAEYSYLKEIHEKYVNEGLREGEMKINLKDYERLKSLENDIRIENRFIGKVLVNLFAQDNSIKGVYKKRGFFRKEEIICTKSLFSILEEAVSDGDFQILYSDGQIICGVGKNKIIMDRFFMK